MTTAFAAMTIRSKLYGLLILMAFAIVTMAGLNYWAGKSVGGSVAAQREVNIDMAILNDLRDAAKEIQLSTYQALNTVTPDQLKQIANTRDAAKQVLDTAHSKLGTHLEGRQLQFHAAMTPLVQSMISASGAVIDTLTSSSNMETLPDRVAAVNDSHNKLRAIIEEISGAIKEAVANSNAAIEGAMFSSVLISLAAAVLTLFVCGLLGLRILASVTAPVKAMANAMRHLAGGDLSVNVPVIVQADEIGEMAAALKVFKEQLIEKRAAEENAAAQAAELRRRHMAELTSEFEQSVGDIVNVVAAASGTLTRTAENLTEMAESTNQQSGAAASSSGQASSNVQAVATAVEQLSASIHEISQRVQQSNGVARDAVRKAETTSGAVRQLNESVAHIGDIVNLINSIAARTNMLALNATIEAARAGEAGRGFAVVAQEVKALAEQTAKATGEIDCQIKGIQDSTQQTTDSIANIARTIENITAASEAITHAVEQQGAVTREIAGNAQMTASATGDVERNISGVRESAKNSSAAATEVLSFARDLARQSETLRSQVGKFLAAVRAA